jgi:hypothetical protein
VIKMRLAAAGGAVALAVAGIVPSALGASAAASPGANGPQRTSGFVIHRSAFGVPTITAGSQGQMWFGAGWAQAQDRMVQLELTRRAVEGTLSEIFGPGELSQDETVRTFFYTPAELTAQFQALPAAMQKALTEFSDGINAYEANAYASAASEAQKVPYEFFVLGQALGLTGPYQPAPWQPEDTVAVGNFLARQFGGGGGSEATNLQFLQYLENELIKTGAKHPFTTAAAIFNDSRWINDPTAPTTVPGPGLHAPAGAAPARADGSLLHAAAGLPAISRAELAKAAAALSADRKTILDTGVTMRVLSHGGSNAIAVSPSRSANGHALLWGAPQEGFGHVVDVARHLILPVFALGLTYMAIYQRLMRAGMLRAAASDHQRGTVTSGPRAQRQLLAAISPTYEFNGRWSRCRPVRRRAAGGAAPVSFTVLWPYGPVVQADPPTTVSVRRRLLEPGDRHPRRVRPARRRREPEPVPALDEPGHHPAQLPLRRPAGQHCLLRRRAGPDRAGRCRPPAARRGRRHPAVDRLRAVRADAAQRQPAPGLPGQLEHQALTAGLLPAERR